jgi:hypothetical protein
MILRSIRLVPALLAAFASLAAPGRAADDVTESRPVAAFDRVELRGAFTATITAGQHASRFSMTGDRDSVDRVTTEVRDGTLVVGMRDGDSYGQHILKLDIGLPTLRDFKIAGAGSVKIYGLTGGDVSLAVPGAASVVAFGKAAHETISLSGTGKIDAGSVAARDVDADLNGVGKITVRGSGSLSLHVNGVGKIDYAGHPQHVDSHVNGLGSISAM